MEVMKNMQEIGHHELFQALCLAMLTLLVLHCTTMVIYRLYFHPLAKFPGPRIAAATHFYEVAWDYFGKGAYLYEIERMHQKYGEFCGEIRAYGE